MGSRFCQRTRSAAIVSFSLQLTPLACKSSLHVDRQVFFGRPLFLLPSAGVHSAWNSVCINIPGQGYELWNVAFFYMGFSKLGLLLIGCIHSMEKVEERLPLPPSPRLTTPPCLRQIVAYRLSENRKSFCVSHRRLKCCKSTPMVLRQMSLRRERGS